MNAARTDANQLQIVRKVKLLHSERSGHLEPAVDICECLKLLLAAL